MKKTISLMIDCSRNAVPNKKFLKQYIDILAKCGFNQLQLYMEDTYKIDGEQFFGYFRGGYTKEDLIEIDNYAYLKGIELVPAIQVLGHLSNIFIWGEYKPMRDCNDCLLVGEEKTYELIDKMIAQVSSTFRSKKVNIGMDESFSSGKGEYLKRHGYKNPDDIFLYHLKRVSEILHKYNREGMMWGDMFYRNMNHGEYYTKTPIISENAKKMIPDNINIIYWDYYSTDPEVVSAMAKSAIALDKNAYFAGGVWSWIGFMPRTDFAINQTKIALPEVKNAGINGYIATLWGDDGAECSKLAVLPALYYFAKLANGINDNQEIAKSFKKDFDIDIKELLELNHLNDLEYKPTNLRNVCKYMFFNDLLMGIYDNTVDEKKASQFTDMKKAYKKNINHPVFGLLFKEAYELANVLEIKYTIGLKIREAYHSKDKEKINLVINSLIDLKDRTTKFYESFKNMWYSENRLEGFEVQTIRIGGLILRIQESIDLLRDFISGKIDKIDPLEQDILIFPMGEKPGHDILTNCYKVNSSVNVH